MDEALAIILWSMIIIVFLEHGFRAGAEGKGFKYIGCVLIIVIAVSSITLLVVT